MGKGQGAAPAVNGYLNLYKPVGMTSMDALRRVKRATRQRKKVGHAGTLDPLAEGVLPVCFGQATRLMEEVVSGLKQYRMTIRLGAVSQTYDAEGEITEVLDPSGLTRRDIAGALANFVGDIRQVPPMYSALRVDGQRLYDLARAGREVQREPRPVYVQSIAIDGINLPFVELTVRCGKGTYLRSIAHDLGQALGCGAYVITLKRETSGAFSADDGVTPEAVEEAADAGEWHQHLFPVDWPLRRLPAVGLTEAESQAIANGQAVGHEPAATLAGEMDRFRLYGPDGAFLALARLSPEGLLAPFKVFRLDEPSPLAPAFG